MIHDSLKSYCTDTNWCTEYKSIRKLCWPDSITFIFSIYLTQGKYDISMNKLDNLISNDNKKRLNPTAFVKTFGVLTLISAAWLLALPKTRWRSGASVKRFQYLSFFSLSSKAFRFFDRYASNFDSIYINRNMTQECTWNEMEICILIIFKIKVNKIFVAKMVVSTI